MKNITSNLTPLLLAAIWLSLPGCASNLPEGQPSCGTTYVTRMLNPDYLAGIDPKSCKSFASRYEKGDTYNTFVRPAPVGIPGGNN